MPRPRKGLYPGFIALGAQSHANNFIGEDHDSMAEVYDAEQSDGLGGAQARAVAPHHSERLISTQSLVASQVQGFFPLIADM